MSDPENVLMRWSRRKLAAAAEPARTTPSDPSSPAASEGVAGQESPAGAEWPDPDRCTLPSMASNASQQVLDSLPPIGAITADTDIRGFLASGVPPGLTRAALRRAWAADPRIRDFVGLADYDWDFNKPGAMAGFGSLEMTDELYRLAARIVGPCPANEPAADPAAGSKASDQSSGELDPAGRSRDTEDREDPAGLVVNVAVEEPVESSEPEQLTQADRETGSARSRPGQPVTSQTVDRRRHGRALPK